MTLVRPAELVARLCSPLAARRGLLAVDYGVSKLGLAAVGSLAHGAAPPQPLPPLPVAASSDGALDAPVLQALRALILAGGYGGLVVGWPLDPHGAPTPECARTRTFVRQLGAARMHLPVALWDERGTTAAARAALRAAAPLTRRGTSARRHVVAPELRGAVDGLAAAHLLRSFLAFAHGLRGADTAASDGRG